MQAGCLTDHLVPDPEASPPLDDPLGREEPLQKYATLDARTPSLLMNPAVQLSHESAYVLHLHHLICSTSAAHSESDVAQIGILTPKRLPDLPSFNQLPADKREVRAVLQHVHEVELSRLEVLLIQQSHRNILLFGAHPRAAVRAGGTADDLQRAASGSSSESSFQTAASESMHSVANYDVQAGGLWIVPVTNESSSTSKKQRQSAQRNDSTNVQIVWAAVKQAAEGAAEVCWQLPHAGEPHGVRV
ncbi:hypothetical protein MMC29_000498 [Sticta canariensis]|nr:hypothetical protein [Sticta canariensis]